MKKVLWQEMRRGESEEAVKFDAVVRIVRDYHSGKLEDNLVISRRESPDFKKCFDA